jgi:hypothetical protein
MMEILFIALMHLIQHPEKYHGKKVRVIGFAALEFEHKALYVSKEDHDNAVTKNGVWLNLEINETNKTYDKKYILVEGVFDKDNLGHLKMFSGSLKNIERAEVWSNGKKSEE